MLSRGTGLFFKERDLSRPPSGIVFDLDIVKISVKLFVTFINELNNTDMNENHFLEISTYL